MNPEYCPSCGEPISPNAVACPQCGACEETGWNERARYQSMDIPYDDLEDDFDYDEFIENEFGQETPSGLKGRPTWFKATVIIITVLLIFYFLSFLF